MRPGQRGTLWIDITELFGEFAVANHPTGVSRVIMNLSDALAAEPGQFHKVRPIFWDPISGKPLTVGEPGLGPLAAFFPTLRSKYESAGQTTRPMRSGIKKGLVTAIPKPIRFRLFPYLNGVTHFVGWARKAGIPMSEIDILAQDCLFVPGSFWLDGYAPPLGALARAKGAAVVGFVHDVLLLSNPEWLPPHHGEQFRRGVETFLPCCTAIVCNSEYTRDELKKYASEMRNIPIKVCRLADAPSPANPRTPKAPSTLSGRRYALLVSTLIPRKNHRLAASAWQQLWSVLGEDTPWLVFVGGGGPDPALAELLAQTGNRVLRFTDVDDAVLEGLYTNAWITVYPSLGEGYGLPVAEALARGKACLATRCGGIGEIAPELIDPISPSNPDELAERVLYYFRNPAELAAREDLIRKRYRPTPWDETARAVRKVMEGSLMCKPAIDSSLF
jgi:glycosyltransferase involved in cell wall biosynthesis